MTLDMSISHFYSITFLFMYFEALHLDISTLTMIMSSWKTDPFIMVKCSFLSQVTVSVFKSSLSGTKTATTAFTYWLHGISFSILLLLTIFFFIFKVVCRQHIVGLIFYLVYLENLCILTGIFDPFTFDIITNIVGSASWKLRLLCYWG